MDGFHVEIVRWIERNSGHQIERTIDAQTTGTLWASLLLTVADKKKEKQKWKDELKKDGKKVKRSNHWREKLDRKVERLHGDKKNRFKQTNLFVECFLWFENLQAAGEQKTTKTFS